MVAKNALLISLMGSLGLSLFSQPAHACGASAVGGGVAVCSLEDIREKARKKWHVGASYGFSDTELKFTIDGQSEKRRVKQSRHIALGVAEWRATPRWSFQMGAGGLLGGTVGPSVPLGPTDDSLALQPGFVGMVGTSFVALRADGIVPFVLLTGQLAGVFSKTENDVSYTASDLRLGTAVGWTLFRTVSPYFVGRVFGGPVAWEVEGQSAQGTDAYHYQVGAGLSVLIDYRVDLYLEGVPFGEQGVTGGLGLAF